MSPRLREGQFFSYSQSQFLRRMFDPASPTFQKVGASARGCGWSEKSAHITASKFLNKLRRMKDSPGAKILEAVGVTKVEWAHRLKEAMYAKDGQGQPSKVCIEALKMIGNLLGEAVSDHVAIQKMTQNVFNAPVMVIQGATDERMKALEAGEVVDSEIVETNDG